MWQRGNQNMAIIDPNTGRPFGEVDPRPKEELGCTPMTEDVLLDLRRRVGQIFPAFGCNFRVTIAGPAGIAAEYLGPTQSRRKKGGRR
jgi:hypothetical protein